MREQKGSAKSRRRPLINIRSNARFEKGLGHCQLTVHLNSHAAFEVLYGPDIPLLEMERAPRDRPQTGGSRLPQAIAPAPSGVPAGPCRSLPISPERDSVELEHSIRAAVDRSDWRERVFAQSPGIRAAREYLSPLARTLRFGQLYLPATRLIAQEALLALVSQHLHALGLSETQNSLRAEWGSHLEIPSDRGFSQLALLSQRAIARVARLWELAEPSIHSRENAQALLDEEISRVVGAAPRSLEDTAPLSSEAPGDPAFVRFDGDGQEPAEASLNQLIYWLTPADASRPQSDLAASLCLTFSSYCSAEIFFRKLRDRYRMIVAKTEATGTWSCEGVMFASLFREWVRVTLSEVEPQLADEVTGFFNQELKPRHRNLCAKVFEGTAADACASPANGDAPPVQLGKCRGLWTGTFALLDLPVEELARQLTIWSSTRYCAIQKTELLECAWETKRLQYRAPNVISLTRHYNRISQWVEYTILSERSLKLRIEKVEQLIEIAKVLCDFKNYFDAMGIISAFESNSVFRLQGHFSRLSTQARDTLNALKVSFTPENNFKGLRTLCEQGLTSAKPVIPYIGVLLSDLFKYYDATQTWVNGLINVRKCKGVFKMISKIEEFMQHRYNFLPIDQVQTKIDELPEWDVELLLSLSYEVETESGSLFDSPGST
jgi:hypothetical protein